MRILLISDDKDLSKTIETILKEENFNVYTTNQGEEGIDLGKLYDYDIILLDLNLPDMSGYEVLKSLRAAKIKTPILILSGIEEIEDKIKGLAYGANDYIQKPRTFIPIDYDPQKYHTNIEKHGIDFNLASKFNHEALFTAFDIKKDYGEARKIGIGMIDNILYYVVYVRRGRVYRVISLRRANEKERNLYVRTLNNN